MVLNSVFDPAELTREREVVFEEVRLNEDNPRSSLGRQLYTLLYQEHPYGRPVLGDAADLRAATQETLRGYYARYYVPNNMTLVVVGPVDPAQRDAEPVGAGDPDLIGPLHPLRILRGERPTQPGPGLADAQGVAAVLERHRRRNGPRWTDRHSASTSTRTSHEVSRSGSPASNSSPEIRSRDAAGGT